MSKNRIGQDSTETIWKSRWIDAYDKLKNDKHFALKNGYPTRDIDRLSNPPSYREYESDPEERQHRRRTKRITPIQIHNEPEEKQPLTSEKKMTDVGYCLRAINILIGILILICLISSVIGLATPYWFDTGTVNVGLFQVCSDSSCDPVSVFTGSATVASSTPDTWTIVRILVISGCSLLFIAILFYCIYVHCTTVDFRKVSFGVLLSILVMLAAGSLLGGMAVMISYYYDIGKTYTLEWSFYLVATSGGVAFFTFCIMIVFDFLLAFQ